MTPTSTFLLLGGLVLASDPARAQATLFAPVVTYPVGSAPRNLAVADVNNDGKADVLTANQNSSTVSVLLGNGNGTFQPPVSYNAGTDSNPHDIAIADVNGDGRPDLLTANYGSNSAGVLLGNGDGTFREATAFATGAANGRPVGIAVGDVNGDGKPDLLTANSVGYSVSLFAGTGTGTFQVPVSYQFSTISVPLDVAVTDFNADGRLDILAVNAGSNSLLTLQNLGGSFQPASYPVGIGASFIPFGLAIGDVNNDGKPDVVTANQGNSTVSVLRNNFPAFPAFGPDVSFQDSGSPENIAVADVNADGQADLLTANPGDAAVGVLLANGAGGFQPLARYSAGAGSVPYGLVVADINGDGRPDVITSNAGSNSIGVLLGGSAVLSSRAALPGATATLHPNPATQVASLTLGGLPATVAQVQATLLDAAGRAVRQYTLAAGQGRARVDVPTAGLAAGLYLLRLAPLDALGAPAGSLPTQRLSVR
jgi:hypothetical protein